MDFIVTVNADSLIAKMDGNPAALRRALLPVINKLSIEVQTSVKQDKLTGQVLHVRTGTLRRSINREVKEQNDGVFATIGTNVKYGIMWENGFDKKIGAGARGGPRTLKGIARERYIMKHPPGTKFQIREYLKPTLKEFAPRIKEELRTVVLGALR